MATGKRDIYCDLTNSAFVTSQLNPQRTKIAACFHQDKITIAIHPLEIDPTRPQNRGPYSELDPAGWTASVKVFNSAGTVLASQTVWAVSGTTLTGSLDLNTAAMATEFPVIPSSITTITGIFEVEITDGTGAKFTFQDTAFVINREYITAGSPSALPATSYYTKDELNALFVRFSGNPDGATITLTNGARETILGVDSDGSIDGDAI